MKKSIQFTAFFASLVILFFTACTKEAPMVELGAPAKYIPDVISIDENLIALDDAMKRFDPLYLQVIYKEKRTKEELQNLSQELLMAYYKNKDNELVQKALSDFYHFESFEALVKASNALTQNALLLKNKYFNNQESPTTKQRLSFFDARKKYLQNKLTVLEKAKQKKASGLWNDMADEIERQLHYYTLVYNEEFESDMNGGGAECSESCCLEFVACQQAAKKDYLSNIVLFSFMSAGGLNSISYRLTANNPVLNPMSPIVGAMIGLSGSILLASKFYKMDLSNCVIKYKACIQRKNEN